MWRGSLFLFWENHMITAEMKRLASYLLEGDREAAFKLFRLMKRLGYGAQAADLNIFSFDEGDYFDYQPERFRATEGKDYRFSFAWWPGSEEDAPNMKAGSPRFYSAQRHWHNPSRCFILNKGPEYTELLGRPKLAAATIIVSWPVDLKGRLHTEEISKYKVQPWVMAQHTFSRVRSLHEDFPFYENDLCFRCSDERFQRLDFRPARRNVFAQLQGREGGEHWIYKDIVRRTKRALADITRFIGRDFSIEDIRRMTQQREEATEFEDLLGGGLY